MLGRKRNPKSSKNKAAATEMDLPPRNKPGESNLDALIFLDSLVAKAPVSRQTHIAAQNAFQQLTKALQRLDAFMIAKSMDKQDEKKPDEQPEEKQDGQQDKNKG